MRATWESAAASIAASASQIAAALSVLADSLVRLNAIRKGGAWGCDDSVACVATECSADDQREAVGGMPKKPKLLESGQQGAPEGIRTSVLCLRRARGSPVVVSQVVAWNSSFRRLHAPESLQIAIPNRAQRGEKILLNVAGSS